MKKSLIALAILAAAGTANAGVEVSGKIRLAVSKSDATGAKVQMSDQASRLTLNSSEDLGGGMKAGFFADYDIDAHDGAEANGGPMGTRQTYAWVSGSFGKVIAGNAYAPYKLIGSASVFEDTAADSSGSSGAKIVGFGHDSQYSQALAYVTPDFNGFHAAIAVTNGGATTQDITEATSLALVYNNGPLSVSYGNEQFNGLASTTAGTADAAQKLNIGYKMGDLGLKATFEDVDNVGATADQENILVSATYGMGAYTLAAQYGKKDSDDNTVDLERTTVGVIYGLSKRTNMAFAYNMDDLAGTETNTWTVQLNHDF